MSDAVDKGYTLTLKKFTRNALYKALEVGAAGTKYWERVQNDDSERSQSALRRADPSLRFDVCIVYADPRKR